MRSLPVLIVVCVLSATSDAGDRAALPRSLGDSIRLGMTQSSFSAAFGTDPTRCASCYGGELLAEVAVTGSPDVNRDLSIIGLKMKSGVAHTADLFFEHGALIAIHIEDLEATNALVVLEHRFGKGRVVQRSTDITGIEWIDGRTRLRLTRFESEIQITLSDWEKEKKMPRKTRQ